MTQGAQFSQIRVVASFFERANEAPIAWSGLSGARTFESRPLAGILRFCYNQFNLPWDPSV